MDEPKIKAKILNLIRKQNRQRSKPIVASEFQIVAGRSRADLAVLDDQFVGIEIKSPRDSLSRLLKQAQDYRQVFDRTILVLHGTHLVKYLSIEMTFCDLWTLDENENLRKISEGNHIPPPDYNFLGMMTSAERQKAFRDPQLSQLSNREKFFHFFRKRYERQSEAFWATTKGRAIRAADLKLLSRYAAARRALENEKDLAKERLKAWLAAQSSAPDH